MSNDKLTQTMFSAEGQAARHARPNCDVVLSRYSECKICSEPLQGCGPHACPRCGGLWCARCSSRISTCVWCEETLRVPATLCLALQRLVNQLLLPCRNSRQGCPELLTANTRSTHEEGCRFDIILCPVDAICPSLSLVELAAHIKSAHNDPSAHSHETTIRLDNFKTVVKNISHRQKVERRIFLLHQRNAFIIKYSVFNSSCVNVQVTRKKLGNIADGAVPKMSEYCAVVQFQTKCFTTETVIRIRNDVYRKKALLNWNKVVKKSDESDSLAIHVRIEKSDS